MYKGSVRHRHDLGTVYKSNEISFISRVSTMLRRSLQQLYNGLEMFLTTMSWALNDTELCLVNVVSSVAALIMSNTRGEAM
jgi:hypothetical protein